MHDLVAFDIFSQNILIAMLLISILRHQLRLIPGQKKNAKKSFVELQWVHSQKCTTYVS